MELLKARWDEGKSVCVGLDSDTGQLPDHLQDRDRYSASDAQLAFNKAIVEATRDIVCAYKPNLAFYAPGNGDYVLRSTVRYIRELAPGVPVILDAKWGDIGNTNNGYLRKLDWYEADAVTIAPYLGRLDGLEPFVERADKGIIILCKTSNKGSGEFQDLRCEWHDGEHTVYVKPEDAHAFPASLDVGITRTIPLYQAVARQIARHWNYNGNCGLVVGATYPEQLAQVRKLVGDFMPILIPGVKTQGGDLEKTVRAGMSTRGGGMIINVSRSVIFASKGEDFAAAARREAGKAHNDIVAVLQAA
jgi:orotidine-5'-phosphate decarboxylase